MSTPAIRTPPAPARLEPAPPVRLRRRRRPVRLIVILLVLALIVGGLGWGGLRLVRSLNTTSAAALPTTHVKRGDVSLTIAAKAELRGGHPEELAAPMTGDNEMHITNLRKAGDVVKEGEVVLEFDTTDQAYKLKEAEADLAEAEQQVIKAQADGAAQQEENNYLLSEGEGGRAAGGAGLPEEPHAFGHRRQAKRSGAQISPRPAVAA